MDLLTLALLAVAVITVYYYFKKQLSYWEDLGVPYVPGWPLLGNMANVLFRRAHIIDTVTALYDYHPEAKYVGVFDFMNPVIMLRDLELIKAITMKNFDSFPARKKVIDANIDPLIGNVTVNLTGERWKESRNLITPAFTTSKMKYMHESMADCAKNCVNHVANLPDRQKEIMDVKDLFSKYAIDSTAMCAFGICVDSFKDPTNKFYMLGKDVCMDNLTWRFLLARSFPAITKLLKVKIIIEPTFELFKNIIDTTVKMRDSKGVSRQDVIQLMMNARDKKYKYLKMDLLDMSVHGFSVFFGSYDPTSTQMCIIAHELAANPDIQKRLQDEIDEVLKSSNENPTYDDIQGMLYFDAVYNESIRRHSQTSFFDRICVEDFELPPALPGGKPFTLKPGMNVWIPITPIHMDPKYYDNPEKFDPDRYYGKKEDINELTNLGFGIGPRRCIGYRFSIFEAKVIFFYVLSKFNLKPTAKTNIPLKYSKSSLSIQDEGGFWLKLEPRHKN